MVIYWTAVDTFLRFVCFGFRLVSTSACVLVSVDVREQSVRVNCHYIIISESTEVQRWGVLEKSRIMLGRN